MNTMSFTLGNLPEQEKPGVIATLQAAGFRREGQRFFNPDIDGSAINALEQRGIDLGFGDGPLEADPNLGIC